MRPSEDVPSLAKAVIEPTRSVAPVVLALTNAAPIAATHARRKPVPSSGRDQIDLVLQVVTGIMARMPSVDSSVQRIPSLTTISLAAFTKYGWRSP